MRLSEHLSRFYQDHVLRGHPKQQAAASLKAALAVDPGLKKEAQDRINELASFDAKTGGNLAKRCYVSHIQKSALEEALNDR